MIPYSLNPLGITSDLDILRQIRDANPTSQLPSLWLDSEDPYTQWEGVSWDVEKTRCIELSISELSITTLSNVNKLIALQALDCPSNQLTTLDVTGLIALQYLECSANQLTTLNLTGLNNLLTLYCDLNQLTILDITGLTILQTLYCYSNQLNAIQSLTSRQNIPEGNANFNDNKFNTSEVNRLLGIGFTAAEIGTQNP